MKKAYVTLIPRNLVLPVARFLSADDEAKYEEIVNKKYSSKKARETLNVRSNLFKVIELKNQGINVAGLSDLGLITEQHKNWISGLYIDVPVVVLRSAGDSYKPNDFLAKDLAKQLRKRAFKGHFLIRGLKLREDVNSRYGLSFKVTDKTEKIEVPELRLKNNYGRFSKIDEKGIPILDENGDRIFCVRDNGLSKLCVGRDSTLHYNWSNLAKSISASQVIVVDAQDTTCENLDDLIKQTEELLARQQKERQNLISKLRA